MKRNLFWSILLVTADLLMFNTSFFIAYNISDVIYGRGILPINTFNEIMVFTNFTLLAIFAFSGLYRGKRGLFDSEDFYLLLKSTVICYFIITAATFIAKPVEYSRLIVTNTFIVGLLMITLARSLLNIVLVRARRGGFDRQKAAILGEGDVGESILRKLGEHAELGYDFAGFLKLGPKLGEELKMNGIRVVFVALPKADQNELIDLVTGCEDVEFKIVPDLVKLISEPLSFDEFKDIPLITILSREKAFYPRFAKRILDAVGSAILLVMFSPLFLFLAFVIKLDSPGPVFFRQTRLGEGGMPFVCYKFRTMREDAEKIKHTLAGMSKQEGLFKMERDPRVTRLGYFLRRTCVDELPQLFNVLVGDMSLVGPRPHVPEEMKYFGGWRKSRFKVKPGLTGIWQVSGRHAINLDKAVLMDVYYIKQMSFLLDLGILIKTIPSIIYSRGRW